MAYVLTLEPQDLEVIAAGLNELPRKHSQPVFARIQAQVEARDKAELEQAKRVAEAATKPSEGPALATVPGETPQS